MTVKDLEVFYDYGYWANKKLFQLISHVNQSFETEWLTKGKSLPQAVSRPQLTQVCT